MLEVFCWQQHSFDGSVRHEMKLIVCFCGHFKFAEGVASKFPVFIAAFKILSVVPFCIVLSSCTSKKQRFVEVPLEKAESLRRSQLVVTGQVALASVCRECTCRWEIIRCGGG